MQPNSDRANFLQDIHNYNYHLNNTSRTLNWEDKELVTSAIVLETNYSSSYVPAWQLVFPPKQNHIQPFSPPWVSFCSTKRVSETRFFVQKACPENTQKEDFGVQITCLSVWSWKWGAKNTEAWQQLGKFSSQWKILRDFSTDTNQKTAGLWIPQNF